MTVCVKCVMDSSDSAITFDKNGLCDHCIDFEKNVKPKWDTGAKGKRELEAIVDRVKKDGRHKDFDCILGMSGGADSSFLLHKLVTEFGLRPLVFHVDGGWNSNIAVNNIKVMIEKLNLDLYTEVINWKEMKDFQLAYFKSGLSNIDIPQDHAFVATLYNFAYKHGIKYIMNGGNISTECVRNPLEWIYYGTDMSQINYIKRNFCQTQLKSYPFSSILRHKFYLRYIKRVRVVKPLNYFPYIKSDAMEFLGSEYGWTPYPQKHFESRFTRFYEAYWLPRRFGFDTRKVQYSSLILTGQMTREEALENLKKPAISDEEGFAEFEYVAKKLDISVEELDRYFKMDKKQYSDYPNQQTIFDIGAKVLRALGVEASVKR